MRDMGEYEILSHTAMPECSIRIIGMKASERVGAHHHEKSRQIYTVLEHEVEARVGEHLLPVARLRDGAHRAGDGATASAP